MLNFQQKQNENGLADSRVSTTAGAREQNSRNDELKTVVVSTGQTLTPNTVQVDTKTDQLAKALFIYGSGSPSMQDNGAVNTIQLTPVTGASGVRIPDSSDGGYSLLNGITVEFAPSFENTGNVTVNIGQTASSLLGAKKLLNFDGSELASGSITTSSLVRCRYDILADSGNGAWILILSIPKATQQEAEDGLNNSSFMTPLRTAQSRGASGQWSQSLATSGWTKAPNGLTIQWGTVSLATGGTVTWTFPVQFDNTCLHVFGNLLSGGTMTTSYSLGSRNLTASTATIDAFHPNGGTASYRVLAIGH